MSLLCLRALRGGRAIEPSHVGGRSKGRARKQRQARVGRALA